MLRRLAACSLLLVARRAAGQPTDSAVGSDSPMGQLTYCLEVRHASHVTRSKPGLAQYMGEIQKDIPVL